MTEMEHRGQELLKKWLGGQINYAEETELFDIAESDAMIKEALEGYIMRNHFEPPVFPLEVVGRIEAQQARPERVKSRGLWIRYVAGLALVFAIGQAIWQNSGPNGQVAVTTDETMVSPSAGELVIYSDDGAAQQPGELQIPAQPLQKRRPLQFAQAVYTPEPTEVFTSGDDAAPVPTMDAGTASLVSVPHKPAVLLVGENPEFYREDPAVTEAPSAPVARTAPLVPPIGLEYFDEEADDVLRSGIRFEENAAGDDVITGYEIDVVAGLSPNGQRGFARDSAGNFGALQGQFQLADAAGPAANRTLKEHKISNDVVIREYEIQRRDIVDPPIQDYNSLVREKYKRKAKPEIGFYHYRKYLRDAAGCLVAGTSDAGHLEEAILKFRVFQDGRIEFLELFGTADSPCVRNISAQVVTGPRWEMQEFYESIDIEVPFKVLYPYLF